MSGHSKWHKIQHKKGKTDAARSASFTKLCRAVTVAAGEGGGDPDMNFSLRLAVEKAKAGNVPKDNIERAIKRGTGELKDGATLTAGLYEGFGPGGVAVMVETVTDNPNRTVSEVKNIFSKAGGSMGNSGSVAWQFEHLGVIRFAPSTEINKDDLELTLIDAGAEDIFSEEELVEVKCSVENFQKVLEAVKSFEIQPDDAGLEWIAKEKIEIDEATGKKLEALYQTFEENDDVKDIYTNAA